MIRSFLVFVGLAFWAILGLGLLTGALGAMRTTLPSSTTAVPGWITTIQPAPSIKIKCPCDMHQADGFVEVSGQGTLTIGPKTTDYSGGRWQSDSPVSFDNHQPAPDKDR